MAEVHKLWVTPDLWLMRVFWRSSWGTKSPFILTLYPLHCASHSCLLPLNGCPDICSRAEPVLELSCTDSGLSGKNTHGTMKSKSVMSKVMSTIHM